MARTRSSSKRQRLASAAESALANIDIVSQLAEFLDADDLCQVKATCKSLGSTNDGAAVNGLSMADEAARRIFDRATEEERAMLPRYMGESWIELYHHLLMLRSRLTFDQLVGRYVEYKGGDKTVVQGKNINRLCNHSQAICGNHIMRAGKHWATFTRSSIGPLIPFIVCGVVRPLPGWEKKRLDWFSPSDDDSTSQKLKRERTNRWEGDVHYCRFIMETGQCYWTDWQEDVQDTNWGGRNNHNGDCTTLGMLLDLGNGTLSVYQYGQRLGTLKDGLAGEYCWIAGCWAGGDVSIQRGYSVNIVI